MTAIAMILSARLLLLWTSVGAFALAYLAMQTPDIAKIGILVVWCVGVVLPVAYLYLRGNHGQSDGS
jgi:hypothetical protein